MKKLSIVLALIMALSCFSLTAFAADETTTAAAETTTAVQAAKVTINVILFDLAGEEADTIVLNYEAAPGAKLTAADILAAVKSRLGDEEVDTENYAIAEEVIAYDDVDLDGAKDDPYKFTETKVVSGGEYTFAVCAYEIDHVANLSNTIGEQLAKIDWKGIVGANVKLINELINASKAAIDSLVNAEWPDADKKEEATEATTAETVETPDTGVSAVAGAAVVVLALSATTAVVLRKKED